MKLTRVSTITVELSREELIDVTEVKIVFHYPSGNKTIIVNDNFELKLCHADILPPSSQEKTPKITPVLAPVVPVPTLSFAKEKIFLFKRRKLVPFGMEVTHDELEKFTKSFLSSRSKKKFEIDFYQFFLEDSEGKKFHTGKATTWHIGLWLLLNPDGLAAACGGRGKTYQTIEFLFSGIRKQLEDRVKSANGIIPKPSLPALQKAKRKYNKKRK